MNVIDRNLLPKRNLHVYFLIDASSCMSGSKIDAVNDAMENLLHKLGEINDINPDANIFIHAIIVNDSPYSLHDEGKTPEEFVWQNIEARGDFYLGRALGILVAEVKRNFCTSDYDPIFFLIASSHSKDVWEFNLKRLNNIESFDWGHKIALEIGDNCDHDILKAFTGYDESIVRVNNIDAINEMIKVTWSYPEWFASDGTFQGCKGDMGLIIDKSVELFGKDIVLAPRLYHILNDYEAFKGNRALSFIFKTIQRDSRFESLLNSNNWYLDSVAFSSNLSLDTGINAKSIQSVLDTIGLGLGETIYLDNSQTSI